MKLKEIENILLSKVVLRMPEELFELWAKEIDLPTDEVIFTAPFSSPGGYWLKTEYTGDRIFPISFGDPKEVLEWEVVKILK